MQEKQSLLDLAIRAAEEAAQPLKAAVSGYRMVHMEDSHDVKLKADLESEKRIRAFLATHSEWPIIGEEEGGDTALPLTDLHYWVVDPLDGTFNYQREIPQCCVSIALMRGSEAQLGVVLDFNRGDLFTGGEGLPFTINGKVHNPRWADEVAKACLCTGFPHAMDRSEASALAYMQGLFRFKKVRMIGTAALSVSYVAAGYFDAYYETGIKLWDIAAGLAFAKSVGAYVSLKPWESEPLTYDFWLAGREDFATG